MSDQKMCMLVLEEYTGDVCISLFPTEVYEWINMPYGGGDKSSYQEDIPNTILSLFQQNDPDGDTIAAVNLTCGSWTNDRALQAVASPELIFGDEVEVYEYCRANDIEIASVYRGMVY